MKTNDNKSVKPQHLAAVALATAVTLPGMAILAEEVEQNSVEQDVVQQTENTEFAGITDTTFYEEESVGEEDPNVNQFNESEKISDEEDLFAGESVDYNIENQEKENLNNDFKAPDSETEVEPKKEILNSEVTTFPKENSEMKAFASEENKETQPKEMKVVEEVKPQNNSLFQFGDGSEENPYQISSAVISSKVVKEWNVKGSGTVEDPYQIAIADDLDFIRENMSSHYILVNDIDLSHIDSFIPIGWKADEEDDVSFYGTFNGNNHSITGLSITEYNPNKPYYGLFASGGRTSKFENLKLHVSINLDLDKPTKYKYENNLSKSVIDICIGGLVGYIYSANYETGHAVNCVDVKGNINLSFSEEKLYSDIDEAIINYRNHFIGGIIGYGLDTIIENSVNSANISVYGDHDRTIHDHFRDVYIGGLAGWLYGTNNSINYGNVEAKFIDENPSVGGIVARAEIVEKCTNVGLLYIQTAKTQNPGWRGWPSVGGIVGYVRSAENCINAGDITIADSRQFSSDAFKWGEIEAAGVIALFGGDDSDKLVNLINIGNINIILPKISDLRFEEISIAGVLGGPTTYYSVNRTPYISDLYNLGDVQFPEGKKAIYFPGYGSGRVLASSGSDNYTDEIPYPNYMQNLYSLENVKRFKKSKYGEKYRCDGVDLPLYDIYARVNKILLENGMPTLEELGRPIESFPGEAEGPISSLDVSKTGREIEAGKMEILSGCYRNNQGKDVLEIAKNIKWISDNEEIAKIKNIMLGTVNKKESSVDFSLFIEGNKPGITMIHGIADDGQKVDFQVTVEPSISFSGSESRNVMWADEYNDHLFFPMNLDPSAKQLAVNCVMSFDGGSFSNDELREFVKSMDLTMERHHLASTSDHVFPTIGKATFKVDEKNRVTVVVPLTLDPNTLSYSAQMDMVLTIKTAAQKKQVRIFLNSVSSIDDGDGLPTATEINGIKVSNNGKLIKTDPKTPDIFVQINWVKGVIGDTATQTTITKKILYDACDMVAKVFKEHGFNLHIDAGPESKDFVTGKLWSEYGSLAKELDYKPESFPLKNEALADILKDIYEDEENKIRMPIFRQCVLLDQFKDDKGTTGLAHLNGAIFSVAMHALGDLSNDDCVRWLAGTIMHELGHTLGLRHGGTDDVNYKPNYLSVMNYAYQAYWQLRTKNAAGEVSFKDYLNYSEYELPEMNKDSLYEKDAQNIYFGMVPKKLKMTLNLKYDKDRSIIWLWDENDRNIDWNRDGIISDSPIKGNIYTSENIKIIPPSTNDWNQIKILNSAVGGFGMTLEEYLESVRKLSVVDEEELPKYIEPDQPIKPVPPVDNPNEQPDKPSNPSEKPDKPVDNNKPGEKPDKPTGKPSTKPEDPGNKPSDKPIVPNEKPTDQNKPSDPEKPSENKPMTPDDEVNKPVVTPSVKDDSSFKEETVNLANRKVVKVDSVSTTRSPETGFAMKKSNSLFAGLMTVVGLGWIVSKKRKEKR